MDTEANRKAAIHLMGTVAAGDIDFSNFAEGATWWAPTMGEVDIPTFKERLAAFGGAINWPGTMTILGITAEGDRVAMEVRGGLPTADGRLYANLYHFLVEFRGGQVTKVKEFCDSAYINDFFGG